MRKYDKKDRLILQHDSLFGTVFKYSYTQFGRSSIFTNNNNPSNFKTTTKERRDGSKFIIVLRKEFGEIYDIITKFNERGQQVSCKRFNKKKKTTFIIYFFYDKDKNKIIWVEDYNGYKSVGFTVLPEKISFFKKILK